MSKLDGQYGDEDSDIDDTVYIIVTTVITIINKHRLYEDKYMLANKFHTIKLA